MGDDSPEKRSGCGLLTAVFGGRNVWPRRSSSDGSIPKSRSQRDSPNPEKDHKHADRIIPRPGPDYCKSPPVYHSPYHAATPNYSKSPQHQGLYTSPQNQSRNGTLTTNAPQGNVQARKVPPGLGISGELENMINDHQRSKGAGNLVRASSGNVMLYGNLGNLRQPGNADAENSTNVLDHLPRTANEEPMPINGKYTASNAVKKTQEPEKPIDKPVSLCRALSTRMDPEQLKILGNEDYKNGRFAEALALYDAAISIDPNKASYRSNKSAALTALGRLLEAAFECREAIRIDPFYQRAHNRLGTLYVRLGELEKGLYHFKQAGSEADPDAINTARKIQNHLEKCTEAKKLRDWNALLRESGLSIAAGADSAPLIYSLKVEALIKLNRPQEAIQTLANGPNFDIDECTKFFGPIASASLLLIHAQIDLIEGRLDESSAAAQRASRLDSNNKEADMMIRKTRAVTIARSNGNEHFKAGRYEEACSAYAEGLKHDPHNTLLLCNRAACRSKLNQYDKSIEDCSAALNVRPGYCKARLRRADCYYKIGNWGACIRDCEALLRENPEDEEADRMLKEAKSRLK